MDTGLKVSVDSLKDDLSAVQLQVSTQEKHGMKVRKEIKNLKKEITSLGNLVDLTKHLTLTNESLKLRPHKYTHFLREKISHYEQENVSIAHKIQEMHALNKHAKDRVFNKIEVARYIYNYNQEIKLGLQTSHFKIYSDSDCILETSFL